MSEDDLVGAEVSRRGIRLSWGAVGVIVSVLVSIGSSVFVVGGIYGRFARVEEQTKQIPELARAVSGLEGEMSALRSIFYPTRSPPPIPRDPTRSPVPPDPTGGPP